MRVDNGPKLFNFETPYSTGFDVIQPCQMHFWLGMIDC